MAINDGMTRTPARVAWALTVLGAVVALATAGCGSGAASSSTSGSSSAPASSSAAGGNSGASSYKAFVASHVPTIDADAAAVVTDCASGAGGTCGTDAAKLAADGKALNNELVTQSAPSSLLDPSIRLGSDLVATFAAGQQVQLDVTNNSSLLSQAVATVKADDGYFDADAAAIAKG